MDEQTATLARLRSSFILGPRPGKKSRKSLEDLSLTHICTLLSAREDVRPVEKMCKALGCEWIWLPIEGGGLDKLSRTDLKAHLETLMARTALAAQPRIYFHCSASIHRTGFFVYLLLRLGGLTSQEALSSLADLRAVTAEQVGDERLALADSLLPSLSAERP